MTNSVKLIGNVASPYTRKMVAYLRYKRIPYEVIWRQAEDALAEMNIEAPKPVLLPVFISVSYTHLTLPTMWYV